MDGSGWYGPTMNTLEHVKRMNRSCKSQRAKLQSVEGGEQVEDVHGLMLPVRTSESHNFTHGLWKRTYVAKV